MVVWICPCRSYGLSDQAGSKEVFLGPVIVKAMMLASFSAEAIVSEVNQCRGSCL